MKSKSENKDPDNVRYCPYCRCKTWHHGKVCEWLDMHSDHPKVELWQGHPVDDPE